MATKDIELVSETIKSAFDHLDEMPEFSFNQLGRIRLVGALSRKFGKQFRNNKRAKAAIDAFDSEMNFVSQLRNLRR